jgi:hypothetical protein
MIDIVSIRCPMATSAFYFPLLAANDQYFTDNLLFRLRETAQAASHNVDLIWVQLTGARVGE